MDRLLRRAVVPFVLAAVLTCGKKTPEAEITPRELPLPTAGVSGQDVVVFPLTLIGASDSLAWDGQLRPRREALDMADSLIFRALEERTPDVVWVPPERLRDAHRRTPSMIADPDRISTQSLRFTAIDRVSGPLASQMRGLVGVAGSRFALVPASLFYFTSLHAAGRAELTLALVDVRTGAVRWRNIAPGEGADPWEALERALKTLNPTIP